VKPAEAPKKEEAKSEVPAPVVVKETPKVEEKKEEPKPAAAAVKV
jgi:hypothetical protein